VAGLAAAIVPAVNVIGIDEITALGEAPEPTAVPERTPELACPVGNLTVEGF
jgi:hypothetical protein